MPIIINYKICDKARECGGIQVCPTGALYWDMKGKMPVIDNKKCTLCLQCTLPDACPTGAILYARNRAEEQRIKKQIATDWRSEEWLWQERYGVAPGRTPPLVKIVNGKNFEKEVLNTQGFVALDIWSYKEMDCRVHSALYSEIKPDMKGSFIFKKIDALANPEILKNLKLKKLPSLLLFRNGKELGRVEGLQPQPYESFKKKVKNLTK